MDRDIEERIDRLSPAKRRLLETLLQAEALPAAAQAAYVEPRNDVERTLAGIWQAVLGVQRIGIHDNYFELGGDSIQCIQVTAKARAAGIRIDADLLFEHPTIAGLAAHAAHAAPAVRAGQDGQAAAPAAVRRFGSMPLLPAQHWFFEQRLTNPNQWNQAIVMRTAPGLTAAILQEALQRAIDHHDALRCRWPGASAGAGAGAQPSAHIAAPGEVAAWEVHDFATASATASAPVEELVEMVGQSLQRKLDIAAGPIQRAAFLDFGAARSGRLVLVSHHLAVDAVSYRILLEDVEAYARSRMSGVAPKSFAASASIIDWSEALVRAAQGDRVRDQLPFWLRQCQEASALPLDRPEGRNLERFSRTVAVTLAPDDTERLLRLAPQRLRTEMPEVLLTALLGALGPRIAGEYLRIEVEGHGRESIAGDIDTSRTIGWFTSLFPVRFRLGRAGWRDTLTEVKDTWRAVPDRGVGYGVLRYLSHWPEARALAGAPRPNVAFNYLGQFDHVLPADAVLQPAEEPYGDLYDGDNDRPYALQVVGAVQNGTLRMQWIHSTEQLDASTIDAIASRFVSELSQIARALEDAGTSHISPSDFPDAGLTPAELDRILGS